MEGFLISILIAACVIVGYKYRDKLKRQTPGDKTYKSVEEASKAYRDLIIQRLLKDGFYLMRVFCPNCKLKGTIYIENNLKAENSPCPVCLIEDIEVLGIGGKKIIYTPPISDEREAQIEATVEMFVEEGLETGKIYRDGLFQ